MAGKNKVINTVLRLQDNMSGGLLNAAKTAKKAGAQIDNSMMTSTRQVIAWKNKAVSSMQEAADNASKLGVAAVGAAATGISAMAYKAATAADDLNTLSKQSGFSTTDIQKWTYASDLVDVAVDDIIGAAKKMKKNMTSTSEDTVEAWKRIGVSVTDSSGNLRSSTDVFYEALSGLSKIKNETERDTVAMTIFGKSADDLAGIVDDGGAALQELGNQAEDLGLILSQDALDGANKFNDVIDTLKAKSGATMSKIGNKFANALLPVAERVGPMLEQALNGPMLDRFSDAIDNAAQKIQDWVDGGGIDRLSDQIQNGLAHGMDLARTAMDWVKQHGDTLIGTLKVLGGLFVAGKALTFAANVITVGQTIFGFIGTIGALAKAFLVAHGASGLLAAAQGALNVVMSANPLGLVLVAASLLAVGIATLYRKSEKFRSFCDKTFGPALNAIKDTFDKVKNAVGGLIDKVKDFLGMDTNKKISLTTEQYSEGAKRRTGGNALGTSYWRGGLTRVNERGGEIMNLPSGTKIIPHDLSRKAVAGGHQISVNVVVQGNVVGNRQFAREMGEEVAGEILKQLDNIA